MVVVVVVVVVVVGWETSARGGGQRVEVLGEAARQLLSVGTDAVEEARLAASGERQAEDVHPGAGHHAAVVDDLALAVEEVVLETAGRNQQGMIDLAIRKEEFEIVCWPSFPQSRPFMRVPWEEAWGFQYANLLGGSREGMRQVAERELEVLDVREVIPHHSPAQR